MVITANSTAASCDELLARLSRPGQPCAPLSRGARPRARSPHTSVHSHGAEPRRVSQTCALLTANSARGAPDAFPVHTESPGAVAAAGTASSGAEPCTPAAVALPTRDAVCVDAARGSCIPRRHSLPSCSQEGGCPGPTLPRRPLLRGPPPAVRNRRGAAVRSAVPEEWAAATDSSGRQGASGERRQDRFWCNYPAIFPKPWEGGAGVPLPHHCHRPFSIWVHRLGAPLPPRGSGESGSLLPDAGGAASCRTSRGRAARRSTSPGRRAPTPGSPRCS